MSGRVKRDPPQCAQAATFLRQLIGRDALAPCTGQDHRALAAWFHLVDLWRTADGAGELAALRALAHVLDGMQKSVWPLAKRAIPHFGDWDDEDRLWGLVMAQRDQRGRTP